MVLSVQEGEWRMRILIKAILILLMIFCFIVIYFFIDQKPIFKPMVSVLALG